MSSTYKLWIHKHMRLSQPQFNTAREMSSTYPLHRTQSASDQPRRGNVKYVLAVNTHTHTKHDQPQINLAWKMSSTYNLWIHKHTRLGQPQINPAREMSSTYSLRRRKHTKYGQPQINPAWKMSSTYTGTPTLHGTLSANQVSKLSSTTYGIGETSHHEKWHGNNEKTHVGFE